MILQHYVNSEETRERALDNNQVKVRYIGKAKNLVGTKGEAYFNKQDDRWYYRPVFQSTVGIVRGEWFRVLEANIDFI